MGFRLGPRVVLVVLSVTRALSAQAPAPAAHHAADRLRFAAGATMAFVSHESGHFSFDLLFSANPYLDAVHFGPIPFFAVTGRNHVNPRQLFAISSAGFWMQEATNEWILSGHSQLRSEHHPMKTGALAFNILMPAAYGVGALFKVGPPERDPRSMASTSGIPEPVIGLIVIAPALLDAYRYLHPEKRWPIWASRAVKLGTVALTFRAASR